MEAGDGKRKRPECSLIKPRLCGYLDERKIQPFALDVEGSVLVVSNFTLCADCKENALPLRRQPFLEAERTVRNLLPLFIRNRYSKVATGIFGADMKVSLINDGPVTILLDTKEL